MSLDTALGACSVAIIDGDKVLAERFEDRTRGHAERLLDMIAEVEKDAGASVNEVDRLAVTVGPGTFTGLRVGLSAARGLALATQIPLIGITTLQAVAANLPSQALNAHDTIACVFDCRRGEVYFQVFDRELTPLGEASLHTVEVAISAISSIQRERPGALHLLGSGVGLVKDHCPHVLTHDGVKDQPVAREIARLAASIADPSAAPPDPLYLRRPDAKLPSKDPLSRAEVTS